MAKRSPLSLNKLKEKNKCAKITRIRDRERSKQEEIIKIQGSGINLFQLSSEKDPSQQQCQMGPASKQKTYEELWLSSITIINSRK